MDIPEALKRIESFAKLAEDWDSYGGRPIFPSAIEKAKQLVGGLFVVPVPDGSILITLGDEAIQLTVDRNGDVSVFLWEPNENTSKAVKNEHP